MGGKVWSEEEERVFWTEIIPSSNKRHLFSRPYTNDARGWESLRQVMQQKMGNLARRKYTALMLYEHFFQNSILERFSPNAARFVRAYIANERLTTGLAPSQRSRSVQRFVQRGSGSGRRPNSMRLTQAQAAKAASATQSQAQEEQETVTEATTGQSHRQNTGTVGVAFSGFSSDADCDADADADGDLDDSMDGFSLVLPRSQRPHRQLLPSFSSLALPPSFTTEPFQDHPSRQPLPSFSSLALSPSFTTELFQFSLPPLSSILSLPLVPAPVTPLSPPAFSSSPHQHAQQQLPAQQQQPNHYFGSSSHNEPNYGNAGNSYHAHGQPSNYNDEDYSTKETLLQTPPADPVPGPVPSSLSHVLSGPLPNSPRKSPIVKNEQSEHKSPLEEIKVEEEGMFVIQWPQE